jgi:hypothetical protein
MIVVQLDVKLLCNSAWHLNHTVANLRKQGFAVDLDYSDRESPDGMVQAVLHVGVPDGTIGLGEVVNTVLAISESMEQPTTAFQNPELWFH